MFNVVTSIAVGVVFGYQDVCLSLVERTGYYLVPSVIAAVVFGPYPWTHTEVDRPWRQVAIAAAAAVVTELFMRLAVFK